MEREIAHFSAESQKNETNSGGNMFLIFQVMELFGCNIKKIQEAQTLENIPYIYGNGKLLIFQKRNFSVHHKKSLIFSQKKAFLTFLETETPKKPFIFQETEFLYIS